MICERMLKERDEQLKEEYDKVLNQKLGGNKLFAFSLCIIEKN